MKRKYLIDFLFLLGINFLVKPIYIFGIDRVVQNEVGAQDYGMYFALFNFTLLYQIILDVGISYYNNKHISQNNNLLKKYLPNALVAKVILANIFGLLLLVGAYGLSFSAQQMQLLTYIAASTILISLIQYFRSNIAALQKFKMDGLFSILDKLMMILALGYVLFINHNIDISILLFVKIQLACYGLTALVVGIAVVVLAGGLQMNFKRHYIIDILKQSFPYALAVFLMTIYSRVDAVMLKQILPDGEFQAGIYATGYRLLDAANMIGLLLAGMLLPIFAKMIKQKEDVKPLVQTAIKLLLAFSITVGICCYFFSNHIMDLLYINTTKVYYRVLSVLMFTLISIVIVHVYGTLLSANGSLKPIIVIAFFGVVANIVINYLLIPNIKVEGAAIATLITQSMVAIAIMIAAIQLFKLPFNFMLIAKVLGFAALLGIATFFLAKSNLPWKISFFLSLTISVIVAYSLRLLNLNQLLSLRQTKELN